MQEWLQLCLIYNPHHYLLWKYNDSCMLGWILQTRERALFYDSHAGYHAAHCFLFSLHRVALLRMDGKITTFHFRLVYCWWSLMIQDCVHQNQLPSNFCISCAIKCENVITLSLGDITVIGRGKKHVLVLAPRFAHWYWLSCWPVSCWLEGNKTPPLSSNVLLIHSKFFFLVLKKNSCAFMIHTLWLMTRFMLGSAVCFQMK